MARPDYQGGSIVNLMGSLVAARGGRPPYPPLELLAHHDLARARNILLLVIDGLGADWLARRSPDGILSRARLGAITSVFPATTAATIASYLTALAPLQHGLTGWFTYLRELGCVMTVLPGTPRYGGVAYRRAGIDPARLFGNTPVFERIRTAGVCLSPAFIAHSDFNLAHAGAAEIIPFEGLRDLFRRASSVLRRRGRWFGSRRPETRYIYAYWPGLDSIGHARGMESQAAATHLAEIEQALEDFIAAASGTDTILLVSADHGQLDTGAEDVIDLADHPQLSDCLLLPLCGEPRAAFCYVRSGRAHQFEDYCRGELGDRVELSPSRQLVEAGLFGTGEPHPRFMERIGDYCLLPRGSHVIRDCLPHEQPHAQIGVHGGLSQAELMVPLCLFHA